MNHFDVFGILPGKAICYSGFRDGQQPGHGSPSYEQVLEDLSILRHHWRYLRLYDVDDHAEMVLDVIRQEQLDFKIMLGAYIVAEMNNYNCPWHGGVYDQKQLDENRKANDRRIELLIGLANRYPDIIQWLSVGNEACVEWTDHYVSPERVMRFAERVKDRASQPVTFCENYLPWLHALEPLANTLDFISIHTYPVWEYKHIGESLDYTKANYYAVADKYAGKPVVITEAGWATQSNGRGIHPANVSEQFQQQYYDMLMEWTARENILCFYFEAFDENWKGSPEPLEPEKHWGLYHSNRTPKLAMRHTVEVVSNS